MAKLPNEHPAWAGPMLVSKGGRGIVCVANLLFVLIFIMQVSGEGEMSSLKMRTLATAMTLGTPHEGKLTDDHIWKMCRHRHPEYIKPAQAVDNEDRRVDWLTYNNIIKWMKRAKKFLLDIGMAKDEPGIIRKWLWLYCIHILHLTSHLQPLLQMQMASRARYLLSTIMMPLGSLRWTRLTMSLRRLERRVVPAMGDESMSHFHGQGSVTLWEISTRRVSMELPSRARPFLPSIY